MPEAMHEGSCGLCDVRIQPGDEIEELDGEWCHAACVSEEEDPWQEWAS